MALDQSALLEVLDAVKAADVGDRVRHAAEPIYQALVEAELTVVIGTAPHERSPERVAQRNGHRARTLAATIVSEWPCRWAKQVMPLPKQWTPVVSPRG